MESQWLTTGMEHSFWHIIITPSASLLKTLWWALCLSLLEQSTPKLCGGVCGYVWWWKTGWTNRTSHFIGHAIYIKINVTSTGLCICLCGHYMHAKPFTAPPWMLTVTFNHVTPSQLLRGDHWQVCRFNKSWCENFWSLNYRVKDLEVSTDLVTLHMDVL